MVRSLSCRTMIRPFKQFEPFRWFPSHFFHLLERPVGGREFWYPLLLLGSQDYDRINRNRAPERQAHCATREHEHQERSSDERRSVERRDAVDPSLQVAHHARRYETPKYNTASS